MSVLSSFKSRAIYTVLSLSIGLASTAAKAQYSGDRVQFVAPFAFEYGSQHLPAGRYTVTRQSPSITMISGKSVNVLALSQTTSDLERVTRGKIVFRNYGQRYFLTQVWVPGKASHLTFDQKKTTKRLEVVAGNTEPTKVEVALLEPAR